MFGSSIVTWKCTLLGDSKWRFLWKTAKVLMKNFHRLQVIFPNAKRDLLHLLSFEKRLVYLYIQEIVNSLKSYKTFSGLLHIFFLFVLVKFVQKKVTYDWNINEISRLLLISEFTLVKIVYILYLAN